MARGRMYLFEHAYLDYGDRIGAVKNWFSSVKTKIWDLFIDLGESSNEFLFFSCGITAVIFFPLMLYAGNNLGTEYLNVATFGYCVVIILPVIWRPIHGAIMGATCGCIILLFSFVIIFIALIVFSLYLAILFSLTASTFLIFVPIRMCTEIRLLYRRIVYQCPYDDCSFRGLPLHICNCGGSYADLLPSFYGIFYHNCIHTDGTKKRLPTLDLLGRKKLERRCGGCSRPLVFSSIGELGVQTIAVVGGPSSGKTVFLTQTIAKLKEYFGTFRHAKVYLDCAEQEKKISSFSTLLEGGQVVDKTVGDVIQALGLAVKLRKPKRFYQLLYLYDEPGEEFTKIERFGRKQMIQNLSGMVLLIDPFSISSLVSFGKELGKTLKPSKASFYKIAVVMINGVTQMGLARGSSKCDIPVAVVISKIDALPTTEYPFLQDLYGEDEKESHSKCREALEKLGEGRSIRALEQKFSNVRYFACSALGRMPDIRNPDPFEAIGVVEPFLWLLGLETVN